METKEISYCFTGMYHSPPFAGFIYLSLYKFYSCVCVYVCVRLWVHVLSGVCASISQWRQSVIREKRKAA